MKKPAKESKQVTNARKKLQKTLEIEHQKFTTEALQEIAKSLRASIARHHPEPEYLAKRKFILYNSNENPAKIKSKQILKQLRYQQSSSEAENR